jgi:hypothetical protein
LNTGCAATTGGGVSGWAGAVSAGGDEWQAVATAAPAIVSSNVR